MPLVDLEMQEFQKTVLQSEYLDALKDEYGELYFIRMERLMKTCQQGEMSKIRLRKAILYSSITKLLQSRLHSLKGEKLNFYGLLKKMQDPDRKIRKMR